MTKKKKSKQEPLSREQVKKQLEEFAKIMQVSPKYKNKLEKKAEQGIDSLQELFDYLRVCIKYMLLDKEASAREIKYLRELLKDKDGGK